MFIVNAPQVRRNTMSRHFLKPHSSNFWVLKTLMLESVSVLLFVPHMMHMLGLFNVLLPKSTLFGMNFILWKVIWHLSELFPLRVTKNILLFLKVTELLFGYQVRIGMLRSNSSGWSFSAHLFRTRNCVVKFASVHLQSNFVGGQNWSDRFCAFNDVDNVPQEI